MTPGQLKLLHTAFSRCKLDEAAKRLILRNVGKVESSKNLTNEKLEDVMAYLEEHHGYRYGGDVSWYWRNKVEQRGRFCSSRMAHFIQELAGQVPNYKLPGLCLRFSDGRTEHPDKLIPAEAHQLAEMLKSAIARQSAPPSTPRSAPITQHSLFDETTSAGAHPLGRGKSAGASPAAADRRSVDNKGAHRLATLPDPDDLLTDEDIPF